MKSSLTKWIGACLCRVVPPNSDLIVFSQTGGKYSDNSRALFEWMRKSGYRVCWLYQDTPPENAEPDQELFVKRRSWLGFCLALRARVFVVSHGLHDFGALAALARHRKVVMLWHGIGIKHLGVLGPMVDSPTVRRETACYDLVTASSDVDRYYNAAHGHVPVEKIAVTGMPRNDRLLSMETERVCGRKSDDGSSVAVLYAPTFRDYPTSDDQPTFFPFVDFDRQYLACELRRLQIRLLLRPHPSDGASMARCKMLAMEHPDVFEFVDPIVVVDTAELIACSNAVISDYSSIYLDFILLNKPCVFIPWDMERYRKSRGIAYDYEMIAPGPKVTSQAEFLDAMRALASCTDDWAEQRQWVRAMFHKYDDARSCERVASAINSLICR